MRLGIRKLLPSVKRLGVADRTPPEARRYRAFLFGPELLHRPTSSGARASRSAMQVHNAAWLLGSRHARPGNGPYDRGLR